MKRSFWGTVLGLLTISTLGFAQIPQLPVDAFSQDYHLSHPTCHALTFDQQGFLWVGTDHGLNRFDGYEFRVFNPSVRAESKRPWGRINALERGNDHSMWVGTTSGLYRISTAPGRSLATTAEPQNCWPTPVRYLLADGAGGIWAASNSQLIHATYNSQSMAVTIRPFQQPHAFLSNGITCMAMEDGKLWIGTAQGLLQFDPNGKLLKQLTVNDPQDAPLPISAILSAPSGLWLGTGTSLYFKPYQLDTFYHTPLPYQGSSNFSQILIDAQENLWITTLGDGLLKLDLKTRAASHYRQDQLRGNLPDETLHAMTLRNDGLLWLATQRSGLVRLQYGKNRFERFIVEPYATQNDRGVTAICEDPLGNLWIGNQDGLVRQDAATGSIIHFFPDPQNPTSLPGDTIQTVLSESNGTLWVGTFRHGLARLAPGSTQFERFGHEPGQASGLPSNQVNDLTLDTRGRVWIGTRSGLVHYDQPNQKFVDWVNPDAKPGDPPIYVISLAPSRGGGLWFGSRQGFGLVRSSETQLYLNQGNKQRIWPTQISYILEDRVGQVWLSAEEGLFRFSPATLQIQEVPIADAVPDKQIHGIMEGKPGDLWLSSNHGLVQMRNGVVYRVFGPSAGLQSREFIEGAVFQAPSGFLYVGGPKGYNRFDPLQEFERQEPPHLVITSLRVMGEERDLDLQKGLVLNHQERFFTIEYSALDYKAANNSQYAFKLAPSDNTWHTTNQQRYLSFANLAGGNYQLQLKAANSEGVWNDTQVELPIQIVPPFWQTRTFRIALILVIILTVVLFMQYRVRHLRKRLIRLQKQANESTKSLYEAHARLAEDAHKAGVAEISTGVLHNIGNILNSVTVSTNALRRILIQSKMTNFQKAVDMIAESDERPSQFFKESRRGGLLSEFFLGAESAIDKENQTLQEETMTLLDQIALMGKAVSLEQSYANRFDKKVKVNMAELVDNAVRLQEMNLKKRNIELFKAYNKVPECNVETFKLAHVITNLVRNAADALNEIDPPPEGRRIIVSVDQTKPDFVQVAVADNGIGISPENLARMFSFGFTTKVHGHGFGLHSSHAIMEEIGGSIEVESEGLGKGACFLLQIPLDSKGKDTAS